MAVDRSRHGRASRKRKRHMDAVEHDLSAVEWTALQAAWNGCAYCGATGQSLQRDCVLPLSRGGRYTLDNIVPACRSCNASKCNHEVTGWMRRKRLDERGFLVRHLEVREALTRRDEDGMELDIRVDDLTHPEVIGLLEHHLVDVAQHSPAESMHALDVEGLRSSDVTFWTAWAGDDLVGCSALKQLDETQGEIKSMRVTDAFQRRGAGATILVHLIDAARESGLTRVSLETGSTRTMAKGVDAFASARALYARHGFVECGPFAGYSEDPWSAFMTLELTAG